MIHFGGKIDLRIDICMILTKSAKQRLQKFIYYFSLRISTPILAISPKLFNFKQTGKKKHFTMTNT